MNLWGAVIILFAPGAVTWLIMSAQTFLSIVFRFHPWGEPMTTALYVAGIWGAACGGVWIFLAVMTTLEKWWTE